MRTERLTWQLIWRLIRYKPLWYTANAICWILFHAWPLIPGLLERALFDSLGGRPGFNLPTLIALVMAAGLARAGIVFSAALTGTPFSFQVQALLHRNLLARILARPGARPVPGTAGEALSTLRDDGDAMTGITGWAFDAVAALLYAIGGIAVLITVDARVTLLVFAPIVAVIAVARSGWWHMWRGWASSAAK